MATDQPTTSVRRRRRYGHPANRISDAAMAPALDWVRGGGSILEAQELFGFSQKAIARRCREHGVSLRATGKRGPDRNSSRGRPGDRHVDKDGYFRVYAPDHPWPRVGKMIPEHVMVMELSIGRRIATGEIVHHKDHDRQNNSLDNLELMSREAHSKHHASTEANQRDRDGLGRFAGPRTRA